MSSANLTDARLDARRRTWRESKRRNYVPNPRPIDPLAAEKAALRDARLRLRALKKRLLAVGRSTVLQAESWRRGAKRWREANGDRHRELQLRWQNENIEHVRVSRTHQKHKRRVWLKGAQNSTPREIEAHRARVGKRCAYCRAQGKLTLDHILAVARGGVHHVRNIQFLCSPCNSAKGARPAEDFARTRGLLL